MIWISGGYSLSLLIAQFPKCHSEIRTPVDAFQPADGYPDSKFRFRPHRRDGNDNHREGYGAEHRNHSFN